MTDHSYYQMLGLSPECSEAEIETAYRALLGRYFEGDAQFQPGAQQAVRRLNQAYVVLTNPERRKQYDHELVLGRQADHPGADQDLPPAVPATDIPEWLKGTEEFRNIPAAAGDVSVPAWMEDLTQEAQERRSLSGERRAAKTFIFISLVFFLLLTLALVMMMLAR